MYNTSFRYIMQQIPDEKVTFLEQELRAMDELRHENLRAIAWLVAENNFLKSVIIGTSPRPLDTIMRDGKEMIEDKYNSLKAANYISLEKIIDLLVRNERYGGM